MSWDILIQDLPKDVTSVSEIPDNFQPAPLGLRNELIERIRSVAPSVDFTDPSWGQLATPEFSIEFNMGREEMCSGIMLHVRGGDGASDFVAGLLHSLDVRAFDCSAGDFFAVPGALESFARWQEYRDRVLKP
ncbi:hypothetical protein [Nocardioides marmorisolisilvae]|uniref:Uncharacterized protein n=1 Tax=Nocardioides marmorisolisilvae TaxID=1542737 RepID=A0A3N0DQ44_9ACTN|nr:hypothetical protein [Nocardioides marmorisolisilvae]RNL77770.1 hypothetical protein EFL95_17410 [Nocardioides marmorisolisilvae]